MDTFIHVLVWGGWLSLGSLIVAAVSWMIDPKIWGADLNLAKKYQNRTGGIITLVVFFGVQFPIMAYTAATYQQMDAELNFWWAFVIIYLTFQVFNLADLIIFDWLIYLKLKPAFMYPDYFPQTGTFKKHFIDFIKGFYIGIIPCLIGTGLWKLFF